MRAGPPAPSLGVPLLREGTPIGVFVLGAQGCSTVHRRRRLDRSLTFADQAVIAIEKCADDSRLNNNVPESWSKSLEDLRTAQDRLVQTQKLASLGQLTAGIAHEIKNPLNFVNNFSASRLIDD